MLLAAASRRAFTSFSLDTAVVQQYLEVRRQLLNAPVPPLFLGRNGTREREAAEAGLASLAHTVFL
ncbi:hypothetical protein [Nannocystis bainbridge]|uniref:Uncharacterized protein n=1 Tax=Nannocystis bainbridge TaxID=2995303 RepID=A0ABT5E542_9BACT|nr:hypothetical protein [Nannocystis bainbridge]MDC0719897.1 hypothetical protein [Nannocystis bainbridge]